MKKFFALLLALLLCLTSAAFAEETLSGGALTVYETVKWAQDMPKTARVISAQDFICKMSDSCTAHYMLIYVTQTEFNAMHFGNSSQLILLNMDTNEVWTYTNVDMNNFPETITPENAHIALFNSYDSYTQGYNDFIWWADGEIVTHMSEEDIAAVNAALEAHFVR